MPDVIATFIAALVAITGFTLDLPPEGIVVPAEATEVAVRLDPPTTTTEPPPAGFSSDSQNGVCIGAIDLLAYYSPGWDARRMARIAYRESRCDPTARNRSSSATGLLQILSSHCPWLARQMGTWCTRDRLTDPDFNIRAGAALWRDGGYRHWAQTA